MPRYESFVREWVCPPGGPEPSDTFLTLIPNLGRLTAFHSPLVTPKNVRIIQSILERNLGIEKLMLDCSEGFPKTGFLEADQILAVILCGHEIFCETLENLHILACFSRHGSGQALRDRARILVWILQTFKRVRIFRVEKFKVDIRDFFLIPGSGPEDDVEEQDQESLATTEMYGMRTWASKDLEVLGFIIHSPNLGCPPTSTPHDDFRSFSTEELEKQSSVFHPFYRPLKSYIDSFPRLDQTLIYYEGYERVWIEE
ncbi:hypothetical protein BGZ83_007426 [Gryganskiella cystojenkinii]|nr:hypothetical protein BGZ83_007426 [Gryganskiella cystojenkinii]